MVARVAVDGAMAFALAAPDLVWVEVDGEEVDAPSFEPIGDGRAVTAEPEDDHVGVFVRVMNVVFLVVRGRSMLLGVFGWWVVWWC